MYLHHTNGLKLQFCKIRSSRSPMKIMAYGGAILVPMAVPLSCLKKDKLCSKILFFNTHSAKSIRKSVDILLSSCTLKVFLTLSSLHHIGYLDISQQHLIVHRIMLSGKWGRLAIFLRKSLVSLI